MKNGTFHQIIGKNILFIKSKNGLDQIIRVKVETQGKVLKFAQPEIHYEKNGVKVNNFNFDDSESVAAVSFSEKTGQDFIEIFKLDRRN